MAGGDESLRDSYYTRDGYMFTGEVQTPQTGEDYYVVHRFQNGDVVWRAGPKRTCIRADDAVL